MISEEICKICDSCKLGCLQNKYQQHCRPLCNRSIALFSFSNEKQKRTKTCCDSLNKSDSTPAGRVEESVVGGEYSQAEEDEEQERVAVRDAVLREHNLHRENAGLDALEWDQQLERLGGCKERLN